MNNSSFSSQMVTRRVQADQAKSGGIRLGSNLFPLAAWKISGNAM